MEEKNDIVSTELDCLEWEVNEDKRTMWEKTTKIRGATKVIAIDQKPNLWDRIKFRSCNLLGFHRAILHIQDPIGSLLRNDHCGLLSVAENADTYKQYPREELRIISKHRKLSEEEYIGLVMTYHKESLISEVKWHLELSDDKATVEVTAPLKMEHLLIRSMTCFDIYRFLQPPSPPEPRP